MKRPEERSRLVLGLIAAVLTIGLVGCSGKTEEKSGSDDKSAAKPVSEATAAALAKADAVDGKEDKVVSKCVICSFSMDGTTDFVAKVGDYTLHLCSEDCKTSVEEDPDKALASVK